MHSAGFRFEYFPFLLLVLTELQHMNNCADSVQEKKAEKKGMASLKGT